MSRRDVELRPARPDVAVPGVGDVEVLDLQRAEDHVRDPDLERVEDEPVAVVGEQGGLSGDAAEVRRELQRDRNPDRVVLEDHVDLAVDGEPLQRGRELARVEVEQRLARGGAGEPDVQLTVPQRDVADAQAAQDHGHVPGGVDRPRMGIDHHPDAGVGNDLEAVESQLAVGHGGTALRMLRVAQEAARLRQRIDVAHMDGRARGRAAVAADRPGASGKAAEPGLTGRCRGAEAGDLDPAGCLPHDRAAPVARRGHARVLQRGGPRRSNHLRRGEVHAVARPAEQQLMARGVGPVDGVDRSRTVLGEVELVRRRADRAPPARSLRPKPGELRSCRTSRTANWPRTRRQAQRRSPAGRPRGKPGWSSSGRGRWGRRRRPARARRRGHRPPTRRQDAGSRHRLRAGSSCRCRQRRRRRTTAVAEANWPAWAA